MRLKIVNFFLKPIRLLSKLSLKLSLNITVTSKYDGISNNIISDWQMKKWLQYISKKKEMIARNKNTTLIFVLNIRICLFLKFINNLSNELLTIQNRNEMLCDSLH